MKKLHVFLVVLLLGAAQVPAQAQTHEKPVPTHRCAADAVKRALELLVFHSGTDTNVGVDETARLLQPLRNPVDRRQWFDVLEVQGYVYRAEYQMRLIYARVPGTCALVGQEILELSRL